MTASKNCIVGIIKVWRTGGGGASGARNEERGTSVIEMGFELRTLEGTLSHVGCSVGLAESHLVRAIYLYRKGTRDLLQTGWGPDEMRSSKAVRLQFCFFKSDHVFRPRFAMDSDPVFCFSSEGLVAQGRGGREGGMIEYPLSIISHPRQLVLPWEPAARFQIRLDVIFCPLSSVSVKGTGGVDFWDELSQVRPGRDAAGRKEKILGGMEGGKARARAPQGSIWFYS